MELDDTPTHVIHSDGLQTWRLNGRLHRTDGPAIIFPDSSHAWSLNGQWQRTDGPAMIHPDGTQTWYLNGQRHRTDGPAVIHPNGSQSWYIKDVDITDQVNAWMNIKQITWPWDESVQTEFSLTWS